MLQLNPINLVKSEKKQTITVVLPSRREDNIDKERHLQPHLLVTMHHIGLFIIFLNTKK